MSPVKRVLIVAAVAIAALAIVVAALLLSQKAPFRATSEADPLFRYETLASREDLVFPDWTASTWLNADDEIAVYFTRPAEDSAAMFVNITDPEGRVATFNVTFTATGFSRVLAHNDGGLLVGNPHELMGDIGGRAVYAGEYTVRVYTHETLVPLYYSDSTMQLLEVGEIIRDPRYKVTVRYLGEEPLYGVEVRDPDSGLVLDATPILETYDALYFESATWRTHVVVTWADGQQKIAVEEPPSD